MCKAADLQTRFPPSAPCSCSICVAYCARPGWWTVREAEHCMESGCSGSMMLEMAPDRSFGVLAPAFRGCEGRFALQRYADYGCTFLRDERCRLFGTGLQPLECRFCYHDRRAEGPACHSALEGDWDSGAGRALIVRWSKITGFWDRFVMPRVAAGARLRGREWEGP